MGNPYRQKLKKFETNLLIRSPLLWIFRIHRILTYLGISVLIAVLFGVLIPLWINPWWLFIAINCINCLFIFYWNKRIESYLSSLFTLRSRLIIYIAEIFFITALGCTPCLISISLHQRSTKILKDPDLLDDVVETAANYHFIVNHYNDLIRNNRVYDTVINIENKTGSLATYYAITNEFFLFVSEYLKDSTGTEKFILSNDNYQTRSVATVGELDTSTHRFKRLEALRDTNTYKWIKTNIPWKFQNEIRKYSVDNESDYHQFLGNAIFKHFHNKEDYEAYYKKVIRLMIGTNAIITEKDLSEEDQAALASRIAEVKNNIEDKSDSLLIVFSVILVLAVTFCSIMLIKQIKGFRNSYEILVWLVVLAIIELAMAIVSINKSTSASSLLILALPAIVMSTSYPLLLIFLASGNTRFVITQNKLLPFLLTFMALSPAMLFSIKASMEDYHRQKVKFLNDHPMSFYFLFLAIFLATVYAVSKKFISFYTSPQRK